VYKAFDPGQAKWNTRSKCRMEADGQMLAICSPCRNAVAGSATLAINRSTGFTSGSAVAAPGWTVRRARLTHDGFDDLIAYHTTSGAVLQLRSNGDGSFVISSATVRPNRQLSVADLNADGLSDGFFYDAASGAITVGIAGGDGSAIVLPLIGPPGLTLLMQGGFRP
jgi:hypothetical protein